jgi:SDR family mycofactocin-dependent oxidoreductase
MTEAPVAVVTGAARGLGAAVARALAEGGWRLVLVDACADQPGLDYPLARPRDLAAVGAELGAATMVGDVRSQADMDAAVAMALDRHGRLDGAVAAAGVIAGGAPAWETSDQVWRLLMEIDAEGVWRVVRACVPALLASPEPRRGRLVAVSSVAGMTGLPLLAAYSAAKHAVVGLMRSVAAELGPYGVTANVVAPGSMSTQMLDASAEIYQLKAPEDFAVHHVTGKLLEPREVAELVKWLMSPASSGVTGAVLPADAGMSAAQ